MANVKKVYLDSRFSMRGGTGSDFRYELADVIECGSNCVAYITDICLPVSWPTVGPTNCKLYVIERSLDEVTHKGRIFTVAGGSYNADSFATALQTALNTTGTAGGLGGTYSVAYSAQHNKYTISNPAITFIVIDTGWLNEPIFKDAIWQCQDPPVQPNGPNYDFANPNAVNGLLGVPSLAGMGSPGFWPFASAQTMGVADLRSVHSVYLHSDALSTFKVVTPCGLPNCIRRVPVALGPFEVIHEGFSVSPFDFLELPNVTLKVIDIQVRDVFGRLIDMQGGHISFSVVFGSRIE